MTQSDKDNHQYTFHKFQQAREKYYAPKFSKLLQAQAIEAAAQIKSGASIPRITSEPIYNLLKSLYTDVATVYAHKVLVNLKRDQKARMPIGFSSRMLQLITQYYGVDFLNMSENITQTTRDYIQRILIESYPLGLGIDDIVAKITDREVSRQRGRVIARTETVGAANRGGLIIAKDTGLNLDKIWIAAKDARTRRDHVLADEKKVRIDEYFVVGGFKMLTPGDRGGKDGMPRVPAKEVVNCRCSAVYEKSEVQRKPEVVPVVKPSFVPAKTIREAREAAGSILNRKYGLNIDSVRSDASLTLEEFNKRNEHLDSLTDEYEIASIYNKKNPVKLSFNSSARYQGVVKMTKGGAELVDINFGHLVSGMDQRVSVGEKLPFLSRVDPNNLRYSTMTHEFAHLITIDDQILPALYTTDTKIRPFWKEMRELRSEYHTELKKIWSNKDAVKEVYLGKYGGTNVNEFMAEGFAEYKLSSTPSQYALKIGKLIDKYFKK